MSLEQLPIDASIKDAVSKVGECYEEWNGYKNTLKTTLISKNVEVSEEDKMSNLIDKVNLLEDKIVPLWLYNDGDECTDITGGFEIQRVVDRIPSVIQKQSSRLYVNSAGDKIGIFKTIKKIDVTKYSKIYFEFECSIIPSTYAESKIVVSTSPDIYLGGGIVAGYRASSNHTRAVYSTDISKVIGEVYFALSTNHYTQNETSLYKIWVEK